VNLGGAGLGAQHERRPDLGGTRSGAQRGRDRLTRCDSSGRHQRQPRFACDQRE
jgi:hypothetical protein